MGRRRGGAEFDAAMAQGLGFLLLLACLYAAVRQVIEKIGGFLFVVLIALVVGLIVFVVSRRRTRSNGLFHMACQTPVGLGFEDEAPAAPPPRIAPQRSDEFIEQLRAIDWFQFERVIAAVYRKLGYTVTRRGGANPDGGIDLIIEKDGERIAVQCKQWKTRSVGVRRVREFLGAMTDAGIWHGKLVTLCGCTGEAERLADKHGIEIVNETELAELLRLTDASYDPQIIAVLRDTRKLCPKCESEMVLRTAGKGSRVGNRFWGCSKYPRCRFTMPVA